MLESANSGVASVHPDDPLVVAETTMIDETYSRLAVIDEQGELHGAVSWESPGRARISHDVTTVSDASVNARSVHHTEDLLEQIGEICRNGYVFVLGGDRTVSGIVTAADLSLRFGDQFRPVVLVEEAERRWRRCPDETRWIRHDLMHVAGPRPGSN